MANYSSATFAILLLLAAAMTAPQTASSALIGGRIVRCWKAILSFEGCVPHVVVPQALNIQLQLTQHCCHVLENISKYCFPTPYTIFSFAPKLGSLLPEICGGYSAYSAPAPQPAIGA